MSRPARCLEPAYYTRRHRRFAFPLTLLDDETRRPLDMDGAQVTAELLAGEDYVPIAVAVLDLQAARFLVSAGPADLAGNDTRQPFKLIVTYTDAIGAMQDFVWPLIPEDA